MLHWFLSDYLELLTEFKYSLYAINDKVAIAKIGSFAGGPAEINLYLPQKWDDNQTLLIVGFTE